MVKKTGPVRWDTMMLNPCRWVYKNHRRPRRPRRPWRPRPTPQPPQQQHQQQQQQQQLLLQQLQQQQQVFGLFRPILDSFGAKLMSSRPRLSSQCTLPQKRSMAAGVIHVMKLDLVVACGSRKLFWFGGGQFRRDTRRLPDVNRLQYIT